jgi:small subunit ribosomal protein S4
MPKRNRRKFSRPRKIYDITLIKDENGLITKYGLKSRREVWKASFAIEKMRNIAKTLITASDDKKEEFIERQKAKGFEINSIADVLALSKEDYLKRRLESVVVKKGFAKTHNQARQLITHKHIKIGNQIINSPSHLTTLEEEKNLTSDIVIPIKEEISPEEKKFLEKMHHEKTKEVEA